MRLTCHAWWFRTLIGIESCELVSSFSFGDLRCHSEILQVEHDSDEALDLTSLLQFQVLVACNNDRVHGLLVFALLKHLQRHFDLPHLAVTVKLDQADCQLVPGQDGSKCGFVGLELI